MNSGLSIAYCLPSDMPIERMDRGDLTQQANLINGLRARGHRVTLCYPRDLADVEFIGPDGERGVVHRTWFTLPPITLLSRAAWRAQRLLGVPYLNVFSNLRLFDAYMRLLPSSGIVFERHGLYRTGVARACRRLRKPYVLFFDADPLFELEFTGQSPKGLLRWRATQTLRYSLHAADRVVCVCDAARDRLMQVWGVPRDRIVVLPNGVDIVHHRPTVELREAIRNEYGLSTEPLVIFVGAFYPWHDIEGLLSSFATVCKSVQDARLLMVGDGDGRALAQAAVSRLDLCRSVIFTGRVPHHKVPALLGAADVAVAPYAHMPTEFWGSPMKVFEYMACGAAIVASAAGQVGQVIRSRENGLLVPPGDAGAMAAAITELLGDRALRARLGARAREDACNNHSWDAYLVRLEGVFQAVLDEKARRTERIR